MAERVRELPSWSVPEPDLIGSFVFEVDGEDVTVTFDPPYLCEPGKTYTALSMHGVNQVWEVEFDASVGLWRQIREADRLPKTRMN